MLGEVWLGEKLAASPRNRLGPELVVFEDDADICAALLSQNQISIINHETKQNLL